jgi:predicted small lipoprotein YifL
MQNGLIRWILFFCLVGVLTGCGQTGRLYLPQPGQEKNHVSSH